MLKRGFDLACAGAGLLILSPLFLMTAALIKMDSAGPVFFRQERIGRGFRPFRIYKFRTMVTGACRGGGPLTLRDDPRITRVGRSLRRLKLDELPQLLNVLKGEMSMVGPRPEVRQFVDRYRADYEQLLAVRPGITDVASVVYRDEAALLAGAADAEVQYAQRILPDKIELAKAHLQKASLLFDLRVIFQTLAAIVFAPGGGPVRPPLPRRIQKLPQ